MLKKTKRFISALCAFVVLISSYAGFALSFQVSAAGNSVSSDLSIDTLYEPYADYDIKVMSYNVLYSIGTGADEMRTVATKEERQKWVPIHVKAYSLH